MNLPTNGSRASAGYVMSRDDVGAPSTTVMPDPAAAVSSDAPVWLSVEDAIELELEWPGVFNYRLAVCPGVIDLDISTGLRIRDAIDQALMLEERAGSVTNPSNDL